MRTHAWAPPTSSPSFPSRASGWKSASRFRCGSPSAWRQRYGLPVYLYEQSARLPERRDLSHVRRGEFETIREEIGSQPARKPDFGPAEVHPSGGATAVGARFPLIAYNVYLGTADVKVAQAVARAVRYSTGGLRYVKALGFEIKERNQVQVSMNLTNYEATPVFRAFEMVVREAERYGVAVTSSEIVGLVPRKALDACAEHYLRLEGFSPGQILENRLADALSNRASDGIGSFAGARRRPGPGARSGGSVAAMAGALAAALGEMMSGLTEGRKKVRGRAGSRLRRQDRPVAGETGARAARAGGRGSLRRGGRRPQAAQGDRGAEDRAAPRRSRRRPATRPRLPLRTVRLAAAVLERLELLVQIGNLNARSDAAAGAQLAFAALKAGQYNVLINLAGLKDAAFAERSRAEAGRLALGRNPCWPASIPS